MNIKMRYDVLILLLIVGNSVSEDCSMSLKDRVDCGYTGINQQSCESKGCCWSPASALYERVESNYPWCFNKGSSGECTVFGWRSSGIEFSDWFYDGMMSNFLKQINVEGSGAVVAAPDRNTPGGSYYYDWMRDGALSMRSFMEVHPLDLNTIRSNMDQYVQWVHLVQNKHDQLANVLVEPKFEIPSGDPYTGAWCRPQTDGPALRAYTLLKYAQLLILNNDLQFVSDHLFNIQDNRIVNIDLNWIVDNWTQSSCDLWEEITSDDIFWNLMAFRFTLQFAADLAQKLNFNTLNAKYLSQIKSIQNKIDSHWNGQFIQQATIRPVDSAVIHAIVSFPGYLQLNDDKIIKTILYFNRQFCREYTINQKETSANLSGLLYGRYPGDHYAGGNPWPLLTSVYAEYFYMAAIQIQSQGLQQQDIASYSQILDINKQASQSQVINALVQAGDSIMNKIYDKVKNDNFRIDEQIDRDLGNQKSAKSLTWSYANLLRALHLRKSIKQITNQTQ